MLKKFKQTMLRSILFLGVFIISGAIVLSARAENTWTELSPNKFLNWTGLASSADGLKLLSATQSDNLYTSIDGGLTWILRTNLPDAPRWSDVVSSADGSKLIALEESEKSYPHISSDGGVNWKEASVAGSRNWIGAASSVDGTELAIVADGGYIYTSTDGGATWTEQTSAGSRNWRSITSSADGMKLAAAANNGYIYTSTDGGATWTEQTSAGLNYWNHLASSVDGMKLAATANGDYIYTSTDGGLSWLKRTLAGSRYWHDITSSSDGTKLAAVESGGYIYTSTDSGVTWTEVTSAGSRDWRGITSSSDGNKLIAVSTDQHIYTNTRNLATVCGNGQIDAGEVCDGSNFNSKTCVTMGHAGGNLACSANCKTIYESNCTTGSVCGDGKKGSDETCDGSQLGDVTCTNLGWIGGILKCNSTCDWDQSGCASSVTPTCVDSDGGENAFVVGYIDVTTATGQKYTDTDHCLSGYELQEASCDFSTYPANPSKGSVIKCENGCKDGACVESQQDDSGDNKLTPAKILKNDDNTLTLQLNRMISELEQKIIDLETRLTLVINKILTNRLKGQLLLQTQGKGEVWYTSPDTGERFYVADGQAAFGILSGMGKGIASKDLQKIAIGYDPNLYGGLVDTDEDGLPDVLEEVIGTDPKNADSDGDGYNDLAEVTGGYNPNGPGSMPLDKAFAKKLKGIYLDVANKGAAWYINPKDFKRYYVSPITAFNVMKYMSLGITDKDLRQVPVGQVSQ